MNYKAVLFDLDGTLLNTLDDLADSMNTVLSKMNLPQHNVEEYKHFIGNGIFNLAKNTLPTKMQTEDIINQCVASMREEYNLRITAKTKPYPEIPKLLDSLIEMGIKVCILTNKPDPAAKHIVSLLLNKWTFDSVFGDRPGVSKKPDPAVALQISKSLGILPQQFLYLGDSGVDMETANNAGMFAVGALWGYRDEDELKQNGAKVLIKNPLELLNLL